LKKRNCSKRNFFSQGKNKAYGNPSNPKGKKRQKKERAGKYIERERSLPVRSFLLRTPKRPRKEVSNRITKSRPKPREESAKMVKKEGLIERLRTGIYPKVIVR